MKIKGLTRKFIIILLIFSIILPDINWGVLTTSAASVNEVKDKKSIELPETQIIPAPVSADVYEAAPLDYVPPIIQTYPELDANARELKDSEVPSEETLEDRVNNIKAKYSASGVMQRSSLNRSLSMEPLLLSKEDIRSLMEQGASIEDIYELAYLAKEQQIDPFELFQMKLAFGDSWDEFRFSLTAQGSRVTEDVYGEELLNEEVNQNLLEPVKDTVTDSVYLQSEMKTLAKSFTTLDMNVASTINDYKMEVINQTSKPQFSDRALSGESIDPASGSLTWKDTQISLPGKDGLDLNLGVIYKSNQAMFIDPFSGIYDYAGSKYDLGTGWSFSLPSVERDTSGNLYYHSGEGAVYNVDFGAASGLETYTHLKGYKGKDIKFEYDFNGSFRNGQNASTYYLEYSDKKREYFGGDNNELLGIVDRFGNSITFKYASVERRVGYPVRLLSEITDSIGRKITFSYDPINNSELSYNVDSAEENIIVKVIDLSGVEAQRVIYTRKRVGYELHTVYSDGSFYRHWIADGKPALTSITTGASSTSTGSSNNPNEKKIKFGYIKGMNFSNTLYKNFHPADYGTGAAGYINLNQVVYPHSVTNYRYKDIKRNYGPRGSIWTSAIDTRSDQIIKSGVVSGEYNKVTYTQTGSYDAFPEYYEQDKYPDSFTYSTTIAQQDALGKTLDSKITFNGKGQTVSTEQNASNGEKIVDKNTSFHATFTQSPTASEHWEYGIGDTDSTASKLYSETSYDDWGYVATTTRAMTENQKNNTQLKAKNTTTYQYEPAYHFISSKSWYPSETSASPLTESYSYTALGRISGQTNANMETTTFTYEGTTTVSKATAEKKALGQTVSKSVITYGANTQYAYPTIQQQYFNIGLANQQIVTNTTVYDMGSGRVKETKDGNNKATLYEYDLLGRPLKVTYPAATNTKGNLITTVEEYKYTPNQISLNYDSVNAGIHSLAVDYTKTVTEKLSASTNSTQITRGIVFYDPFGNTLLDEHWDEYQGKWLNSQYHYDTMGRAVYAEDAADNTLSVGYDAWGKQNRATNANGDLIVSDYSIKSRTNTSYIQDKTTGEQLNYVLDSYDVWGNKISSLTYRDWPANKQSISESLRYDISGQVTGYTDPNGNKNEDGVTTSYSYDALGRLSAVKDALNQTTSYTYDGNGQMAKVTIQAKNGAPQTLNTKTSNEIGLLSVKQDGASQSESYTYNDLGQLTAKTDRNGSSFSYLYDELGRLKNNKISGIINSVAQVQETSMIYGDGAVAKQSIEVKLNNVVAATQTQTLDSLGRVRSVYSTAGSYTSNIGTTKDELGRITVLTDSSLGFSTNYQYNKQRLESVQTNGSTLRNSSDSVNVVYSYNANNLVQSITYPKLTDGSKLVTNYKYYKALGWTDTVENIKGSSVLSSYKYGYDNNGNRTTVSESRNGGAIQTTSYTYDALNRLLTITRPDGKITYTYDVRGNRLTLSDTSSATPDVVDTSYTYDLQNTLTSVTKGSSTTSFKYYADSLRYLKTNGNTQARVNYNLNGEVITEEKLVNGVVTEQANFVRGDRVLVKKDKKAAKDYYYLYNGHGDVVQIVNTSGAVVNNYSYDEWGNITSQVEGISNPFKYTGEIYDTETGLYYLRARYYDPSIGRFLNEDTYEGQIDNPLSQNLYTYVHNNPLIYSDPTGHHAAANGGSGGDPLYNVSTTDATSKVIDARTANAATQAKILKSLMKEYKYGFYGDDSGGMTRNQFEYLYSLATAKGLKNYDTAIWAIAQLDEFFNYGANDKTIAAAGMVGLMAAGTISGGSNKKSQNHISIEDLGLKDGMSLKTNAALEKALQFLGAGYTDSGNGRYVSANGERVVRMGDTDILGKHGGGPHMNFETLAENPNKPGKMKVIENLHIYLED